ncbi:MAG TPA: D-alanine--D-alanine ligase family protein [Thermoanaerobaculia bacterium]|nr:D-alanine--D-alanine ligase family protein [Thermoanaerobaculia bacterium]
MRTRVAVVFGGASVEREVSVVSARTIVSGFPGDRYETVPVAIDPSGHFRGDADSRAILARGFEAAGPASVRLPAGRFDGIDLAFPIVHGETGEDGTLQGFFETLGIPYAGSDVAGSALGMNKAAFKARMREAGLPVARSVAVDAAAWETGAASVADRVAARLPLPLFVKPSSGGSSLGVTKVKGWEELAPAVAAALAYDRTVLVEEGIDAREIECAVLGNDAPEASGCGEIVPGREFYDYEDKYISGGARLLVPAPLPPEIAEEVRAIALRAFAIAGCSGFARVDFFVDKGSGRVLLNEVNTLPGFTSISMFPKLWGEAGIPLGDLLDRIAALAFERAESRGRAAAARPRPARLS